MLVTVRCPADGVVGVSVADLMTVLVRSGSDVELTYACPSCGSPIVVSASVEPGLTALAGDLRTCRVPLTGGSRRSECAVAVPCPLRRREDGPRIAAYAEYFHRELAHADTADAMLAEIDARCR